MKKFIDKKSYQIVYEGSHKELESILRCLVEKVQKKLISEFTSLSKETKQISLYPSQRINYNLEKIVYLPNTSNKKFIFPILIKNSETADVKFLEKNPLYKIKIYGSVVM